MKASAITVQLVGLAAVCAGSSVLASRRDAKEAPPPGYNVADVGTLPGGTVSRAFGINNQGQVVGEAESRAFLWQAGKMKDLGTPGGSHSIAYSINDRGQVVGRFATGKRIGGGGSGSYAVYHSFLWQDGKTKDLALFEAVGINGRGQIVGDRLEKPAMGPDSRKRATLWDSGSLTDLVLLPNTNSSSASGLNDRGQIIGNARDAGTQNSRAFLWEKGRMMLLGSLPGGESSGSDARDINERGQVVGCSWRTGPKANHAVLWERSTMTDLGTLGGIYSCANAINEAGQVVGVSYAAEGHPGSDWPGRAFFWQKGKISDLNDLIPRGSGWVLQQALDINDRGQIVGTGEIKGQTHGFVLTAFGGP
jgi:probable HAF family extracellular repeat protein